MTRTRYPLRFSDIPVREPFVLVDQATQTYFLYVESDTSRSEESRSGTIVYQSKDLRWWSTPTTVYRVPDTGWADPTAGARSPAVHRYRGKYYLITTQQNPSTVIAAAQRAPAPGDYDGDSVWQHQTARASVIAVADSPLGPFVDLNPESPVTDPSLMTLDGSLHVDPDGTPWLVFAQDWAQKPDAPMAAVRLTSDLSRAAAPPIWLFKGKSAPWYDDPIAGAPPGRSLVNDLQGPPYATEAPRVYRTPGRRLVMLWSSYRRRFTEYVQTQALSRTGNIAGPWEQLEPLVTGNEGHGMVFRTFDGRLMLILHTHHDDPSASRAELVEVDVTDEGVKVLE